MTQLPEPLKPGQVKYKKAEDVFTARLAATLKAIETGVVDAAKLKLVVKAAS